jgi:hypothetical protein
MAQKKRNKTQRVPANTNEDKTNKDLWGIYGLEAVYYQRGIQVGLWSIIGGIAVGALLTQFFALVEQVQASRWYLILYFVASLFILINGWVMVSWGALVLKWPIYFPMIIPSYMTQIGLAIMCLLVIYPSGWSAALGGVIFFLLMQQVIFMVSGTWEKFSPQWVKGIRITLSIYFLLMVMCFSASAFLFFNPSRNAEMIWGLFVFLSSAAAIVMQHKGMERERKELGIP